MLDDIVISTVWNFFSRYRLNDIVSNSDIIDAIYLLSKMIEIYTLHIKKKYIYNKNNIQYILEIQWLKERKKKKKKNSKIEKK